MRNYTLTSPYMKGPEVRTAQSILGVPADGELGPVTMSAIVQWKRDFGYPKSYIKPIFTASDYAYLTGAKRQTPAMKMRALHRRRKAQKAMGASKRAMIRMVEWANQGTFETRRNYVPRVAAYLKKHGAPRSIHEMGYPWCAAAALGSALPEGATAKAGIQKYRFNGLYVPEILDRARRGEYGMRVIPFGQEQPGDLVIFNFDGGVPDHIGRLVSRNGNAGTWRCVEGNTSAGNLGSQSNGDGCYIRLRPRSVIQAFVRDS